MKIFSNLVCLFFLLFPPFIHSTEMQVKIINSTQDLPENFCTIWQKGDFLLSDGQYLAIIGNSSRPIKGTTNFPSSNAWGSIISFVPAGEKVVSNICLGTPYLRIKEKRIFPAYSSLKSIKKGIPQGALVFQADSHYLGKNGQKAEIKTIYYFWPKQGLIDVTSSLKNTGNKEFNDLNFSLNFNALTCYSFSPFNFEIHPDMHFRIYQKEGHYLGWINLNPATDEERQPGNLGPGQVFKLNYKLLVATQASDLLYRIYDILGIKAAKAIINFKDYDGGLMEAVVKDVTSPSVFFSSFLNDTFSLDIPLPQGAYSVQAHFFPAVSEQFLVVKQGEENVCTLTNPPLEKVKIKIENSQGDFIPGKVTFIGLWPTRTPYFKPEDPIKSGRYWETFKNSCYPPEGGMELEIPVGTYLVFASHGPEYSLDQKTVEILQGKDQELIFHLDHVVDSQGLICIDPHMHTQYSDGEVTIAERIKSVIAEGIEVAVATDHNYINDYYPVLKKLGLNNYLAVIPGNEITTSGLIHFNTYPLEVREKEEGNGAIWPVADEVSFLFQASRQKDPQALIQVNHPRAGDTGYFNNYHLDLASASYALKNFDTSFDLLEVMNGPYFYPSNRVAIEDWLHLLNRGYYFPLVGSSDSHSIDKDEPGYSRTYVFYQGKTGDDLDRDSLIKALKKGRSFATNGPLVEFKVNGSFIPGDLIPAPTGEIKTLIKVQSAPWVAVDEVRLIINGQRKIRKIIFPVQHKEKSNPIFSEEVGLELKKDSYIAVEVLGLKSLYPVLQTPASNGQLEKAVLPYALTNPIFIDVDGNGKFDPLLPEKIKLISDIPRSNIVIERY